ncbi:MAG TPA: hypothetical protein VFK05_12515 [Polyangiaceae bacterium]|nr:hypothetical protein [Polyangiaceae bacterium]
MRFANGRISLNSPSRPSRYSTIVLYGYAVDMVWVAPKPIRREETIGDVWPVIVECGLHEPWMYEPYGWPPGEPDTRSPAEKETEEAARVPFLKGPPPLGGEYKLYFRTTRASFIKDGVVVPKGFEYIDYASYIGPASLSA